MCLRQKRIFGAEYDSICEWFIETNVRTLHEIISDSTGWGKYQPLDQIKVVETGSSEKYCTNNIYDFYGNVSEWTQEKWPGDYVFAPIIRGIARDVYNRTEASGASPYNGFRTALCIK